MVCSDNIDRKTTTGDSDLSDAMLQRHQLMVLLLLAGMAPISLMQILYLVVFL